MLVQVTKPFVPDGETEERREGELLEVTPSAAQALIGLGFVRAHVPLAGPVETKRRRHDDDETPEDGDDDGVPV